MLALPADNYSDIALPDHWTSYYDSLELSAKVDLFEAMYRAVSVNEQTLIVNDMKKFLMNPEDIPLASTSTKTDK